MEGPHVGVAYAAPASSASTVPASLIGDLLDGPPLRQLVERRWIDLYDDALGLGPVFPQLLKELLEGVERGHPGRAVDQ